MDNGWPAVPGADRRTAVAYGPDRRLAAAFLTGAAVFAVLGFGAGDAPGRLLYGLAVLTLIVLAVSDLRAGTRLVVDATGLRVRTAFSNTHLSWPEVEQVHVDERARLGLTARTLEIDAADRLFVLSARALGTDPREVAGVIAELRNPPAG